MDFKGHFPLHRGQCHPLTVLDDHSRFALGLEACGSQTGTTIQPRLAQIFERYGLPDCILSDNGAPWWGTKGGSVTQISMWLIRLGIRLTRCRPYHPQTQGKDERFQPHPESRGDRLSPVDDASPVPARVRPMANCL